MLKWASLAISGEILELTSRTLMSSSPQPGAMKFYNKRVYPPSLCTAKPLPGCKGAKSEDFSLLLWEEELCRPHRARAVTMITRDPRDPASPFSRSLNWSHPVLLLPTLPVTLPHCKADEGVCVCVVVVFQFLTWFSPPPKLEHFPSRYKEGRARCRRQVGTAPSLPVCELLLFALKHFPEVPGPTASPQSQDRGILLWADS